MRVLIFCLISASLAACAARTPVQNTERGPGSTKAAPLYDLEQLQAALGMNRTPHDLGLNEKLFDSCRMKFGDSAKCGARYLSILHFRLTCRDSEGTVDEVVTSLKPLASDHVEFQLAGSRGILRSDNDGYVQLKVVGTAPMRGQRLVITVGKQFFGKEISEVEQLVLPNYWCR